MMFQRDLQHSEKLLYTQVCFNTVKEYILKPAKGKPGSRFQMSSLTEVV